MILEIHNVLFSIITKIYLQCEFRVCLFMYMYIYWMTLNLHLCILS